MIVAVAINASINASEFMPDVVRIGGAAHGALNRLQPGDRAAGSRAELGHGGHDTAIAPASLGQIQSLVGTPESQRGIFPMAPVGNANRYRHLETGTKRREINVLDAAPDTLSGNDGALGDGVGQYHGEFLAAVAAEKIGLAQRLPGRFRNLLQHLVTSQMAVLVVDSVARRKYCARSQV